MLRMPALRAAWKTLNVLRMLLWNVATSLRRPGAGWYRGQVDQGVERRRRGLVGSGRGVVLAEQRVDDLAVVGQVHPQEARAARTGDVDVEDLVSGLAQAG